MRFRFAAVSAVAFSLVAFLCAGEARAAAEVHRLNLVISANPTSIAGGDFNKVIDYYNLTTLRPYGNEELQHVAFGWAFDGELRYFVRPSFAVSAGVTHLRSAQKLEFLPQIGQSDNVIAEILAVPIHVGGAYYMQPYNQGDFQARAFLGGGLVQYAHTRATFEQISLGDVLLGPSRKYAVTQDAPGYYLEGGAHMFFASHYSVLLSVLYRTGQLRNAQYDELTLNRHELPVPTDPPAVASTPNGGPLRLDVGGVGVRFAVGIGF